MAWIYQRGRGVPVSGRHSISMAGGELGHPITGVAALRWLLQQHDDRPRMRTLYLRILIYQQ